MKKLLKAAALLAVMLPSQAWAEKTVGEECADRGGMWIGDPIGSLDKGYCLLTLTANPDVGNAATCEKAGGTLSADKCKLPAASFAKYVKKAPVKQAPDMKQTSQTPYVKQVPR